MITDTASLPLFLVSVFAISITGALMPGPVTAVIVTRGSQHREAGALIAVGHGLIELPLIALIYFGLASFINMDSVRIAVGLIGGSVLLWMAYDMFRHTPNMYTGQKKEARGFVLAGLVLTAANPYFFVWWATVGVALIVTAGDFGGGAIVAMGATHWLCDLACLLLLSWVVFKSKRLWTQRVNR